MNELTADNLQLWRGEHHVLRGVCLAVSGGECLQVTGANGAGKTTLLRALCGLTPLEDGQVRWRGGDVALDRLAFHDELSYLGHDNALKADLTAAENLRYTAALCRRVGAVEIAAALERTGVAEAADQLLRQLSAGQRRRVALARVLLKRGALWVLDEPGSNLDAHGQALLRELVAQHLQDGGTAVIATHQGLDLPGTPARCLTLQ
ncbi:MAG TPA: cytochrome c biogenesis heme-transporting ATPase CcmA [Steroidobacteraceae bacterium]|jgi:heme exporter protein A